VASASHLKKTIPLYHVQKRPQLGRNIYLRRTRREMLLYIIVQ
jgi:hypothetical protein